MFVNKFFVITPVCLMIYNEIYDNVKNILLIYNSFDTTCSNTTNPTNVTLHTNTAVGCLLNCCKL